MDDTPPLLISFFPSPSRSHLICFLPLPSWASFTWHPSHTLTPILSVRCQAGGEVAGHLFLAGAVCLNSRELCTLARTRPSHQGRGEKEETGEGRRRHRKWHVCALAELKMAFKGGATAVEPEDLVPEDIVPEDRVAKDLVPEDLVPEDLVPEQLRQHEKRLVSMSKTLVLPLCDSYSYKCLQYQTLSYQIISARHLTTTFSTII